MESKHTVRQISRGRGPAIHTYYDISPVSPNSSRIVYSEYESETIPGPVRVVVADRDGANPREVGRAESGNGHVGAMAMWIDDDHVAYLPGGPNSGSCSVIKADGSGTEVARIDHQLRSFHYGRGLGVITGGGGGHGGAGAEDRYRLMRSFALWHWPDGKIEPLLTADAVEAIHPLADRFDAGRVSFQNQKFSPDGTQMLVVFSNEIYCRPRGLKRTVKSLIVLDVDPADPAPRYLGEFSDHPIWTADGRGILAHTSEEGGGRCLTRFDAASGETEILVRGVHGAHPTLTADGKHIISDPMDWREPGRAAVVRYRVADGTCEVLAAGNHGATDHTGGCHVHPKLSADEREIWFNMADTGVPQLYSLRLAT